VQGYYELNKKDKEDEGDGIFDAPRDGGRKHRGIDISGPLGTPILAVAEGVVVIRSTDKGGYGRQVVIDHGNGFFTQYGHLEENDVPPAPGTRVRAGDIIGTLGRSGNTPRKGDPHLHFEVRLGSPWAKARVEDPLKYLPPRPARRANGS
jgi:murein DD-endopeptidase MepM/ murein hydrolase activator NlpD